MPNSSETFWPDSFFAPRVTGTNKQRDSRQDSGAQQDLKCDQAVPAFPVGERLSQPDRDCQKRHNQNRNYRKDPTHKIPPRLFNLRPIKLP
jgi:hypothetical protein